MTDSSARSDDASLFRCSCARARESGLDPLPSLYKEVVEYLWVEFEKRPQKESERLILAKIQLGIRAAREQAAREVAQALDVAAAVRHVRFELARRRRLAQSSLPMALLPPVRILIAVVVHSKRCTYLSRLREVCVPYGDRAGPDWIHFLDHFLLTRQRPTCQGVACALS
jgi:hypothetical protein